MKTRDEIAKELADKQTVSVLKKEIEEIKSILSHFTDSLRDFNPKHEHVYRLSDEVPLKRLKEAIDEIPKQIEVATTHTTDSKSNRFLWSYFVISSLLMALSLGFGVWSYFDFRAKERARESRELEILRRGQDEGISAVFEALPPKTQGYMLRTYPDFFAEYVKTSE